jgi:hypothetical protein
VLHGFNPNVFELAIAHSAGIPVVLLSEKKPGAVYATS